MYFFLYFVLNYAIKYEGPKYTPQWIFIYVGAHETNPDQGRENFWFPWEHTEVSRQLCSSVIHATKWGSAGRKSAECELEDQRGSGWEQVTSSLRLEGWVRANQTEMRKYRSKGKSRNKCSEARDSFDYLGNWKTNKTQTFLKTRQWTGGVRFYGTFADNVSEFVLGFKGNESHWSFFSQGLPSSDWYLF